MSSKKEDLALILENLRKDIKTGIKVDDSRPFIPTGLMEKLIIAVGECKHFIYKSQMLNKCGKTATLVQIIKNIIWKPDLNYFNYPLYTKSLYPFKDPDGLPNRRVRIITTPTSAGDAGALREEILKWFPKQKYTAYKNKKGYYSQYYCIDDDNNNWVIDIMTHQQDPMELESSVVPIHIIDEPVVSPNMIGAITSRSILGGGIIIAGFTPIAQENGACKVGVLIDMLDDLSAQGAKTFEHYGTVWDNCTEEPGIMNSKGTRRGLMTPEEVQECFLRIPKDQHQQRLFGQSLHSSGKVYKDINENHIVEVDYNNWWIKESEHYMIMDPHDSGYPAIIWALITPPIFSGQSKIIIRQEWPQIRTLNGYYDEKRHVEKCYYTPEQISNIIKILDAPELGLAKPIRIIDPKFAENTKATYTKTSEGIIDYYLQYGIKFEQPPIKTISSGRDWIRELLKYDRFQPLSGSNEPRLFIDRSCINVYRCLTRQYYEQENEESERYKDFIDCIRMLGAYTGFNNHVYTKPLNKADYLNNRARHIKKATTYEEMFKKEKEFSI